MIYKEEIQDAIDEFELLERGCSCHLNPPCSYCVHPGNPDNLAETDDEDKYLCLYRYENHGRKVVLIVLPVERLTPKGYVLVETKWVANYGIKRYAYPTKAQAWQSFRARKRKEITMLSDRLDCCKYVLEFVKQSDAKRW